VGGRPAGTAGTAGGSYAWGIAAAGMALHILKCLAHACRALPAILSACQELTGGPR
jgi:hypothetical protein